MLPDSAPPFSLAGLLAVFQRWKYLLALALVLAALVSGFVALRLPNVYSSTAVFLPTAPQGADPDRLVEGTKLDLVTRPEDLDRTVTIGTSQPLAELMLRKFNLYQHYNAGKPGSDLVENAALHEFSSNLSVVHTERDAIELTFQDTDKKLAARVANALVAAIDSVNQQLTFASRQQVLALFGQRSAALGGSYAAARQRMQALRRRYGIVGQEVQSRYLAKTLLETERELHEASPGSGRATGLRQAYFGLTHGRAEGGNVVNMPDWTQGSDSVNLLAARLTELQARYAQSQANYDQAAVSLQSRVSSLYLVQQALPATRKSKPARSVIVLSSVALTGIFSIVLILLLELLRRRRAGEEVMR